MSERVPLGFVKLPPGYSVRRTDDHFYWTLDVPGDPTDWRRTMGERTKVALSDWLDPDVPAERLADMLGLILCTPHLDWLLLTKRPDLWREQLAAAGAAAGTEAGLLLALAWGSGRYPSNVWVGATVEDQARAGERIPHLLRIPAAKRFLSCEPLVGPLDLDEWLTKECACYGTGYDGGTWDPHPVAAHGDIHWVICGGERGPDARPMHPDWVRSLRDQCQAAGVPFFLKQQGTAQPEVSG